MAKKTDLTNPFAKTISEPVTPTIDNSDLDIGNIKPLSAGVKQGEIDALQTIANEMEIARNALIRAAIRYFIKSYREGKVTKTSLFDTQTITKVTLK